MVAQQARVIDYTKEIDNGFTKAVDNLNGAINNLGEQAEGVRDAMEQFSKNVVDSRSSRSLRSVSDGSRRVNARLRKPTKEKNYFISMTDMMVGLLFVFIIMLMTFALSYRQREDFSQGDIEKLRKAVEVVDRKIEDFKEVYQTRARFLEDLEHRLDRVGVQVKAYPATGVLRLGEGILFDSESSIIKQPIGGINIRKIGAILAEVLPCYLANPSVVRPPGCSADA